MTKPLPPLLFGPLFPASTLVKMGGVLDGAMIKIYIDGEPAASGPLSIDAWGKIGKELKLSQTVTATQTLDGEESGQTVAGIVVQLPPDTLSAPEFATIINEFSTVVGIGRLDIGATLTITRSDNGQAVATVQVDRGFMYVRLDKTVSLTRAGSLRARQTLGSEASDQRESPPLRNIDFIIKTKTVPQPRGYPPFVSCQSALRLGGEPGLEVVVHNEGYDTSWVVNYPQDFNVTDCQTLRRGKLDITQAIERLELSAKSDTFVVDAPAPPGKPAVFGPYCPKTAHLWVTGLVPGAQLSLFAQEAATQNWILIGRTKADADGQRLPVPVIDLPVNPEPSLRVTQSLCEFESAPSDPVSLPGPTAQLDPRIKFPIVDCSDFAIITNVLPGGVILLRDQNGTVIADPTCVTGDPTYVKFYRPVHADGDAISGSVEYCDTVREIQKITVVGVPNASTWLHPIKPNDRELHFSKCVVASRIELSYQPPRETKNPDKSLVFVGAYYPQDEEWRIPVPVELELGGEFQFVVRVCNRLVTKGAQTVKLGTMVVKSSPGQVYSNKTTPITVAANDADTAANIQGEVYLDGKYSGKTFSTINVAPPTATPISGLVKAEDYLDGSFSISVVTPPPPPPRVHVKLVSKAPGNQIEQHIDYDMTVSGTNCPGGAVVVSIIYQDSDGTADASGNLKRWTQTDEVATATVPAADPSKGKFTVTTSFTVPMYAPGTNLLLNNGVMVKVAIGSLILQKNLLVNGDDTDL